MKFNIVSMVTVRWVYRVDMKLQVALATAETTRRALLGPRTVTLTGSGSTTLKIRNTINFVHNLDDI